jgi:hypothetical protein
MSPSDQAPPPVNRPKFWTYYRERDLSAHEVARKFGRSREWLRLITLLFEDPGRRIPDQDDVEAIRIWTRGEVGPADWYRPAPSAADVMQGADR